ncbi:MAG TPA: hypothetical protein VKY73_12315 [Polyangiaceae bacterium]|nr:hypothetical protein [Polyangiaceae bacterium]
MKRAKRLTRKERKNLDPTRAERLRRNAPHIHCIACGRHLDPGEFTSSPPTAVELTCDHGTRFPSCTDCEVTARYLVSEHDRTGGAVARARAWH